MTSEPPGASGERVVGENPGAAFGADRRLHPAATAVDAVASLRGLALPLIALAVVGGSGGGAARALGFVALGALVSVATGVLSWRATSFRLTGGALRFRSGIFSPDDTVVPVARIQAIDTVRGPVQRLLGVVALHVQTPGGGASGEIVLAALSPADARALRAALGHPEPAIEGAFRRLRPGPLLLAALTAPQFGVVLPVVGAALAGAEDLFGSVDADLLTRADDPRQLAVVAAAALSAAFVISFLAAIVAFAGFEVERDDDRLRIRRGLLQRRTASVPVARIDGVTIVEGLLRAPFGLATVRLETAGYREEGPAAQTLFPLLRTRDVPALLAELLPGLDGRGLPLCRPPSRSLRRYLTAPALVGAALGAAIVLADPRGWPGVPVLALVGALHGALGFRAAGVSLEPGRVVLRARRGTARTTIVARRLRLQEVSVRRSPLQRRARMATFGLALGSGRRGRVRHLEAIDAERAQDRLHAPG